MRSFFDKFLDFWSELTLWNQFGLAFVAAAGLLVLIYLLV